MTSFPEGWFFIRNQNNGFVMTAEKNSVGEHVVISSMRNKDFEGQLWQHTNDGRLLNRKTGLVLDLAKGQAKNGNDVVQQNMIESSDTQSFELTPERHIFLKQDPKLVLGIKDSFFGRREGQHIHLQALDPKEKKEQRWDIITVTERPSSSSTKTGVSTTSLGSIVSSSSIHHESTVEETTTFPDKEFFIKSESTGYFIGVEAGSAKTPGAKINLEPLRKNSFESQLWHFDPVTSRLVNKHSGFFLSAEELNNNTHLCQSASSSDKTYSHQAWVITNNEIRLKNDTSFYLASKADSWFGLGREGASLILQKGTDQKKMTNHKFICVLPIFKETSTEVATVTERIGVFPDGWFFIKNQKHSLVITAVGNDKLATKVTVTHIDSDNYNRQLWKFSDGFLINKASNLALDISGGRISKGSELCQYTRKTENIDNQQWGLSVDGFIYPKSNSKVVLAISSSLLDSYNLALATRKTPDYEEQRWNFVLPVFKQKEALVTKTEVKKTVVHHCYAQYPSSWFFIRSFIGGTTAEKPYVLTADGSSHRIYLTRISKTNWRYQLWMYWNGVLINFATQKAIDTGDSSTLNITQLNRKAGSASQRLTLTIDGYLVRVSDVSTSLVPTPIADSEDYTLTVSEISSVSREHRWGLLTPTIKTEKGVQILFSWTICFLTEWKKFSTTHVQKIVPSIANWPEDRFFISAHDGMALVPDKSEAFSLVVVRKLAYSQFEQFEWTYRDGYIVHCATNLVLHASDDLVGGSQLQIREQLISGSKTGDQRQQWIVKTDGSIASEVKENLGFALLQKDNQYFVQLAYISNTSEHYSWQFLRGLYQSHFSTQLNKEIRIILRTETILLTIRTKKVLRSSDTNTKLVTHSYGLFPQNWFFIRSTVDKSFVITAPNKKKGSKLTLSRLDFTIFRRQLWRYQDGCLVSLESGYVMDVAGGALNAGSEIIQYSENFLARNRKNQTWGLSTDGHIHPKSRPGVVLTIKNNSAVEGATLKLNNRGSLDLEHQRWTFASPVFTSKITGHVGSTINLTDTDGKNISIEKIDESSLKTCSSEIFKRTETISIVRRWALFPEGGFFIRSSYGDQHLALTVEKTKRVCEDGSSEYEVTFRPVDFKEYQWSFWFYKDGHLINSQTGYALDYEGAKGLLIENGLRSPLFVREKSMSESQFWSLSVNGEIHVRSDQKLVIGASSAERATVVGAQAGIREVRVHRFVNEKGQHETTLKTEAWMRWIISRPVFTTRTTTTETSTTESTITKTTEKDGQTAHQVIESLTDEELVFKKEEDSTDDIEADESDDESDEEDESSTSIIGGLGVATATAGAAIVSGASQLIGSLTGFGSKSSTDVTSGKQDVTKASDTSIKTSYDSLKNDVKESFHASIDYVATGFEKIVRYRTYKKTNFPRSGYFFIRSYINNYVLDVINGETTENAQVVIAPLRTTNYASQLWSYHDGRLTNLKNPNFVLDGSATDTLKSGERVTLAVRNTSSDESDQHWELDINSGTIYLKSNPSLVLSVDKSQGITESTKSVDVFMKEQKSRSSSNFARSDQRWELRIPALIPMEQTENTSANSKYTIIEAGKISAISSSVSAIVAFHWLKETVRHKVSCDNQWPSSENWFFIRVGNENAFLAAGDHASSEVNFVALGDNEDHKRFLWVYVNGYLVNYKYMLRLVIDKSSNKLMLSSSSSTLNQMISVSKKGYFYVSIDSEITYLNLEKADNKYQVIISSESTESTQTLQLHIPVFYDHEVEKDTKIALSTVVSWIQSSQTTTTTTTTITTTVTRITQHYGVFPATTWFFMKINNEEGDSLVLAVKEGSNKDGARLELQKLSFKDFKSQLWTFRDGLLINYGSKYVIDVDDEITEFSHVVQTKEAGESTQKWVLTTDGQVQMESYRQFTLGYKHTESLTSGTEVILVKSQWCKESSETTNIQWRFSVPVFGKKTETKVTMSSIERISHCIEEGSTIETIEEAEIKVEDNFVKKNSAIQNNTTLTTGKEHQHKFQGILKDAGIAITAGLATTAVIGAGTKIVSSITDKKDEKKHSEAPHTEKTEVEENATSAITDVNKKTESVVIRRNKRTSVQIIQESRSIVRSWRIVFIRRIHHCHSKSEFIQVIEESREDLFRRLDEHLRVYASIDSLVTGSVPEWHVSIHQVKELYRARIFERFLDQLNNVDEITSVNDIDFDNVLTSATEEVEKHYSLVIKEQEHRHTSSETSTHENESSVQESVITSIDTIKVTVRYWFIHLYQVISEAKKNGSSEEEIETIIRNSRDKLSEKLTAIKTSVISHIEKSSSTTLISKLPSIQSTIDIAIVQSEKTTNEQLDFICSKKYYYESYDHWLEVSRTIEERLLTQLKVYQTAITQEVSEVQKTETTEENAAQISVVLDEKMTDVAQQTIANKLIETQTKLSSWFIEVTQQISYILKEHDQADQDSCKRDITDIIEAALIEASTRIEETRLVTRAYYAHLTYLSWADRRRLEYSLDNIKASIIATVNQFKKSLEKTDITKEEIDRYCSCSFGVSTSSVVLKELQEIVTTVTKSKQSTVVVHKENATTSTGMPIVTDIKTAIEQTIVHDADFKDTVTHDTMTHDASTDTVAKDTVNDIVVEDTEKDTAVKDTVKNAVVEDIIVKDSVVDHTLADSSVSDTVIIGDSVVKDAVVDDSIAGDTVVGGTIIGGTIVAGTLIGGTIVSGTDSKDSATEIQKSEEVGDIQVIEKTKLTVKEKPTLTTIYSNLQSTIHQWLSTLVTRVGECTQKKNVDSFEEIDTVISQAQEEFFTAIEKVKNQTTVAIGTSDSALHQSLAWIRHTIWYQAFEIKYIGYEVISSEEELEYFNKKTHEYNEKILVNVDKYIEKCKVAISQMHISYNESSIIASDGKKSEGIDYSKSGHGCAIEKSKVAVGVLIEDTRVTVQHLFKKLTLAITERQKEGGDNVKEDIEAIIKKNKQEIDTCIKKSQANFEKKVTAIQQSSEYSRVDIEIVDETYKKVQSTLSKIEESILVHVNKVEQVSTSSVTASEEEYHEKIKVVFEETCQKIDSTLVVSETIISHHIEVVAESASTSNTISKVTKTESSIENVKLCEEYGLLIVNETIKNVSTHISELVERIHHRITIEYISTEEELNESINTSLLELDEICQKAKVKADNELTEVTDEKFDKEYFISVIESIRSSARHRIAQIQTIVCDRKTEQKVINKKLLQVAEEYRHEVCTYQESVKTTILKKHEKVATVIQQGQKYTIENHQKKDDKKDDSKIDLGKKVLIGSAAVAAGTAIAIGAVKTYTDYKEKNEKLEKETSDVIEDVKIKFNKWFSTLTSTVVSQVKQSTVSKEVISETIEKSKNEFLKIIKNEKTSMVIKESYQQQIFTWIEKTVIAQSTRIQEIVTEYSSSVVDIESRLEIIKVSTSQEVTVALDKCKKIKSSSKKYVGVTVEQLKQKEAVLLDTRSELTLVIQDVKSSLVTYFQKFISSVSHRLEEGGDNVEKDISVLIATSRKDISKHIESVKISAVKRLSSLETKSKTSVISIGALSGITTSQIMNILTLSEKLLVQKVNKVHSCVWYIEKDQDLSAIIEKIKIIETETVEEINVKVEGAQSEFICALNDNNNAGHICTGGKTKKNTSVSKTNEAVITASLSIQEIKITIRQLLSRLAETVSISSQNGQSAEEIEKIVTEEQENITKYLDSSVTKISENIKSEESIKHLHLTINKVKTVVVKTSAEIKEVAITSSGKKHSYGGFDKITSIITKYEHRISEELVTCESKITTTIKTETKAEDAGVDTEESSDDSDSDNENVDHKTKSVVTVEYIKTTVHEWLEELMIEVSTYAKREHTLEIVSKEIDTIVSEAKDYLSAEFDLIIKTIRKSKTETSVTQEFISIIEWTRGMVIQSSSQIQAIGVNCAVAFTSSGGLDQMRPLVKVTEEQINQALTRCSSSHKIDIRINSVHCEKKKIQKENRQRLENSSSESDSDSDTESKKTSKWNKSKVDQSTTSKKDQKTKKDTVSDSDSNNTAGKKTKKSSEVKKTKKDESTSVKKEKKSKDNETSDSDSDSDSATEKKIKKTSEAKKTKKDECTSAKKEKKSKADDTSDSDSETDTDTAIGKKSKKTSEAKKTKKDESTSVKKEKKSKVDDTSDSESDTAIGKKSKKTKKEDASSESDTEGKPKKKVECEKDKKKPSKEKVQGAADTVPSESSDEESSMKDKITKGAKLSVIGKLGRKIKSKLGKASSDSSSESFSESDSEEKITESGKKKLVIQQSDLDVNVIIRQWFEQLIIDMSTRAKKGGSKASADIDTILQKATKSLTEFLTIITQRVCTVTQDTETASQYRVTVEWIKNLVIQSSLQIKVIAINSALSSSSKTGGIEQMRPIAVAIQQQIEFETRRYKLVIDKKYQEYIEKSQAISIAEHNTNIEKVSAGKTSVVTHKENCVKLEKHVETVVNETKTIINSWLSQLVRDISICLHSDEHNVDEEVTAIIKESRTKLDEKLKRCHSKLVSSTEVYKGDNTFTSIETSILTSFKTIQSTIDTRITEIKKVIQEDSGSDINQKLVAILEQSKVTVNETLETTVQESAKVIQQETKESESIIVIVDTIDHLKASVCSHQNKLVEEIHSVTIDETITNKQERITTLIAETNKEIERIITESRTVISEQCSSVKKISKSKQQELISSIDIVQKNFTQDSKKIEKISIGVVEKKSTIDIKESLTSIFRLSRNKMDTFLTGSAAVVVGGATSVIALGSIRRKKDKKNKTEKTKVTRADWSLDVKENVSILTKWFKTFTRQVRKTVERNEGDVVTNIEVTCKNSEQEIIQIILSARADYFRRLAQEKLDQKEYEYACKHYEQSLESIRESITSQISEVKKVAIHAHSSGDTKNLKENLSKTTVVLSESIKVSMESAAFMNKKTQTSTNTGVAVVKSDDEMIGEQDIDFERKQSTAISHEKKKTEEEQKQQWLSTEAIIAGTLAVGAATATAGAYIYNQNEKDKKQKDEKADKKDDKTDKKDDKTGMKDTVISGGRLSYQDASMDSNIDKLKISISSWFKIFVQKASSACRSGASSKDIKIIVEQSRNEFTQIIEKHKKIGVHYCSNVAERKEFNSKIEWIANIAHTQAVQIQEVAINASTSKQDVSTQILELSKATYQQIEVTLNQLKIVMKQNYTTFPSTVDYKDASVIDHFNIEKTDTESEVLCGQQTTTVIDQKKLAYTVIQETRITTITIFASLTEKVISRIHQGGSSIEADISTIITQSETEINKVFNEAKSNTKIDSETRVEIEKALTSIHECVNEQINEVKTVTVEAVNTTSSSTEVTIERLKEISIKSQTTIETRFNKVSETFVQGLLVVTQSAEQATEVVQKWFAGLKSSIEKLLEVEDCNSEETQVKVNELVAEAETEMETQVAHIQEQATTSSNVTSEDNSRQQLASFFEKLKITTASQLNVIKGAFKHEKCDKDQINTILKTSEQQLKQETTNHYHSIEKITSVEHVKSSLDTKTDKKDSKNYYKDTIEKVAIGTASTAAAAALAIGIHKNNQKTQTTTVQVVEETSIVEFESKIDQWLTRLSERVIACTKKDGHDVSAEVTKVVEEAKAELEVTVHEAKGHSHTDDSTCSTADCGRSFDNTIEWVKNTAMIQCNQITTIVTQSRTSTITIETQIENYMKVTKQQIHQALEVHRANEMSTIVDQTDKNQTVKHENVVEVITETREQTKKRFELEATVIVQESKTRVTKWLMILLESMTTIIKKNSENCRHELTKKLDIAEKEADGFVRETKENFLKISTSYATSHVEKSTQEMIINSVKQTLDCIESIKSTLHTQITVMREIITRIQVDEVTIITERLYAVIHRTEKRVHHTFEVGMQMAISSSFEGKVITWTETATIPQTFKNVQIIAFDVVGTVVDYQKSLKKVWKEIATKKNNSTLLNLDIDMLIEQWYHIFIELVQESFSQKQCTKDSKNLQQALIRILKRYYISELLTSSEIDRLCDSWKKMVVHEDASIGLRKIKNLTQTKYSAIAISNALSTRNMISIAQNSCLCWNAQFSSNMFAASQEYSSASDALLKGTLELLELENPSQLAIVSSNPKLLSAARMQGCHTIMVKREEDCKSESDNLNFDINVDGLDILGESIESFWEHETMVKVWHQDATPPVTKSWIPKLNFFKQ
ncbi:hypothetical protein BDB01DRAFT_735435 [Pilobolus umbonatus]|nr:hypothetical protein BDB01DRAFT_735435 [Pilobolus umbonatus]